MPMPGWWRHLNKHFFNPRELKKATRWALVTHVGRRSGVTYTTPIAAFPVQGGFATYLMYGRNTDWAKNVLASQSGTLKVDGQDYRICGARIQPAAEILPELPAGTEQPPSYLRVSEMLRFDVSEA